MVCWIVAAHHLIQFMNKDGRTAARQTNVLDTASSNLLHCSVAHVCHSGCTLRPLKPHLRHRRSPHLWRVKTKRTRQEDQNQLKKGITVRKSLSAHHVPNKDRRHPMIC
jgi:hypothetical protein